jgi:hypothetical protein
MEKEIELERKLFFNRITYDFLVIEDFEDETKFTYALLFSSIRSDMVANDALDSLTLSYPFTI